MNKEGLKKNTVTSLVWKLFERGGRAIVELAVQVVMARLLAPDEFGALAIMLVFINVGNVIVQSGLNTALVQAESIDDDDTSTVFWLSFGASILLYGIVFFASPLIAEFYGMEYIVWPLRALSLILLITALNSVQVALVQRELKLRKVFNATLVAVLISGAAGIAAAVIGAGLWALVLQQLLYQTINCIVLRLQIRWRPSLVFSRSKARKHFSFSWKLLASGLLEQGYQSLSDLIIGKQFSATSLGLVSQGKKYPQALGSMLDGAIQPVMLSAVSRVQSDVSQVKRLVRRALKTSTFLIVPSMTLFAVAAEPIVGLLLGEKWLPCVPFLQMYCFIYALFPIHTSNLQALNGMGRSDLFLKLELVKKAYGICFILFAAFVLKDVHLMVAMYMFSGVIATIVNAHPNKRVIGYSYGEQLRDIAPAFALSAVAGGLALLCGSFVSNEVLRIVVDVAVMAVAYLGLARLLHLESLEYLLATLKEMLGSRRGSKA
nr:lipopolysaccharide biosynthesis protein [uncultured Senegalimassilia sp.]